MMVHQPAPVEVEEIFRMIHNQQEINGMRIFLLHKAFSQLPKAKVSFIFEFLVFKSKKQATLKEIINTMQLEKSHYGY